MCGRYALKRSDFQTFNEWLEYRQNEKLHTGEHRNAILNASPTQLLPVILEDPSGEFKAEWMHWGLLQPWNDKISDGGKTFNARAETLLEKKTWKGPFLKQRCLVIADWFYEWKELPESDLFGSSDKKKKPKKVKYKIRLKGEVPFAMAGLWNEWINEETGEVKGTFSIVTTEANKLMQEVHHRMPVILFPNDYHQWLNRNENHPETLQHFLQQFPADQMELFPYEE